ncbi:Hypothetical protein CGLY_05960 [Corynebacterium glyciniphilum AJ 3170]|uniref:DinB-like domain-containing protein n=1 Tax=Corynebacterium glyciniphilum AJ 3170 TaxID=1404245 RepID=X5E871_9CORY|nr:DUF664 domain-containing protein [Corynebacterium glyciniphilum]AHW63640.1 Hypothetical protein CGLY_05960 [Corynebacterium glyciniphilum AJ 3170]
MSSDDLDTLEGVDGISRNPHYNAFVSVTTEILAGYDAALDTLDDDTVNRSPRPGTVNTAFGLVTHVHGMAHYWGGAFIGGEDIPRDRDAEFRASGTVADARRLVDEVRGRLPDWARIALTEGIRNREATGTSRRDIAEVTPEWVLEHILHELAQHLGHLEVCRDVVGVDA